jgi:hypothetical protein
MKYQKIAIWRAFLPKRDVFSHLPLPYPPAVPASGPPDQTQGKKLPAACLPLLPPEKSEAAAVALCAPPSPPSPEHGCGRGGGSSGGGPARPSRGADENAVGLRVAELIEVPAGAVG